MTSSLRLLYFCRSSIILDNARTAAGRLVSRGDGWGARNWVRSWAKWAWRSDVGIELEQTGQGWNRLRSVRGSGGGAAAVVEEEEVAPEGLSLRRLGILKAVLG